MTTTMDWHFSSVLLIFVLNNINKHEIKASRVSLASDKLQRNGGDNAEIKRNERCIYIYIINDSTLCNSPIFLSV